MSAKIQVTPLYSVWRLGMSPTLKELGIDRLSIEEGLRLIGEIWERLPPIDQMEIPESHGEELDRRLAAADADPAAGRPWRRSGQDWVGIDKS
jgi:putative addiction module component (TIGR02574 family)